MTTTSTMQAAPLISEHSLRVLVIIPAFNEEESLARVIGLVRAVVPQADIAIVNDGSTDKTGQIADELGVVVLNLPHNLGIGSAMQTGFVYARRQGYDLAIQVDGDGQHDPKEISELIHHLIANEADVVIGSRYIEDRGYITPWPRRIGIIILSSIISMIVHQRITDPTSGFRVINKRTIEFCSKDYPFDYPEPESVVTFKRSRLKVKEIPVTMNPRYGGQSSITPFRSLYYMIKVILAILITLLRERPEVAKQERYVETEY